MLQGYQVEFEAMADGKRVKKKWKFTTQKPKETLYKISKKRTVLKVNKGEQVVLYFEPRSNRDVLSNIRHTAKLYTSYLDQNTLLVMVPNRHTAKKYTLQAGEREVVFTLIP